MKKRPRTRVKSNYRLKKDEYIRYRGKKGFRKFNPKIKLIAEVWHKKKGFTRKVFSKFPRRYTVRTKNLILERRESREFKKIEPTRQINLLATIDNNRGPVANQIPTRWINEVRRLLQISKKIEGTPSAYWNIKIRHPKLPGVLETGIRKTDRTTGLKMDMAIAIIAILQRNAIRTSPKKYIDKDDKYYTDNWGYSRTYEIELELLGL